MVPQPPRTIDESTRQNSQAAAEKLRSELEALALQIRSLVLAQPPVALLGYVWSKFYLGRAEEYRAEGQQSPDSELTKRIQQTLEYMHAVWSSDAGPYPNGALDEPKAAELLEVCAAMVDKALFHAMASSAASAGTEFGAVSQDFEFHAKSSWILIRGHRYQVLEEEFLEFVLAPHDAALQTAYGIDSKAIAAGIQAISDSQRMGFSDALRVLHERFDQCRTLMATQGLSMEQALIELRAKDASFDTPMSGVFADLFMGGVCNLSKHTKLPSIILSDLAYEPGEEKAFFAEGLFQGTPYRRLPARVKPLIELGEDYYATDSQFVRDSAYRAIQWGLLRRVPTYREAWLINQGKLAERALPTILADQLKGSRIFEEVYFKDSATGQWVETDLVGVIDDVLFVVESKAGVMAMHSPTTDYHVHVRTIQRLVIDAYHQCRRFLEYLASSDEVPLFRLVDGTYEEIVRLKKKAFRRIFPIGLTIESFTPFSSMCKALPAIQPILGAHPFVSMSVDDLFVLCRFLRTGGELFHYLDVRQAIAGIIPATIFDELDHLGAYIRDNRFDQTLKKELENADVIATASFSDVVDRHFEKEDWRTAPVPAQAYPVEILEILDALDRMHPAGWLRIDAHLRDFGSEGRENLAAQIQSLKRSLKDHPVRRILVDTEPPFQVWVCREGRRPSDHEIQRQAMIGCLVFNKPLVAGVCVEFEPNLRISNVICFAAHTPPVVRVDYGDLKNEAEKQKGRFIDLRKKP